MEGAGWGRLEPLPSRKGGLDCGAGSQTARSRRTGTLVLLMGSGVREAGGSPSGVSEREVWKVKGCWGGQGGREEEEISCGGDVF